MGSLRLTSLLEPTFNQYMFISKEPRTYSPEAVRASLGFVIVLCIGAWALFFFIAPSDGIWPALGLPLILTGCLIYGLYRNRRS